MAFVAWQPQQYIKNQHTVDISEPHLKIVIIPRGHMMWFIISRGLRKYDLQYQNLAQNHIGVPKSQIRLLSTRRQSPDGGIYLCRMVSHIGFRISIWRLEKEKEI